MPRLTGEDAVEYAKGHSVGVNHYTTPLEEARENVDPDDEMIQSMLREDAGLVYIDVPDPKFYPIRSSYVGPNHAGRVPTAAPGYRDSYYIQQHLGRKNMSHQECVEGWLGTTQDFSEVALGKFDTVEEAREAIFSDAAGQSNVRPWWEGSGVTQPEDGEEVWVVRNAETGELYSADFDADDLDLTIKEGAVILHDAEDAGADSEAWRKAVEQVTGEPVEDTRDITVAERDQAIETLRAAGWLVEEVADVGWEVYMILGRPLVAATATDES